MINNFSIFFPGSTQKTGSLYTGGTGLRSALPIQKHMCRGREEQTITSQSFATLLKRKNKPRKVKGSFFSSRQETVTIWRVSLFACVDVCLVARLLSFLSVIPKKVDIETIVIQLKFH